MPPRMSAPRRQPDRLPHAESRTFPPPQTTEPATRDVYGSWENGQFRFHSPQSAEAWQRSAYRQGVSAENWHHGKEIDERTRDLAKAGIGGAMPGMYQGPDGKHRFINQRTIEDKDVRDHRLQHIRNKTMDQLAATKMPGEDELMAKQKAKAQPVSPQITPGQSAPIQRPAPPAANDNARAAAAPAIQGNMPAEGKEKVAAGIGRFAGMPKALAEAGAGEDEGRLFIQGLSGDTADYGRALFGATGKWWDGEKWSDAYANALTEEEAKTEEVRKRLGLAGIALEAAPGLIPVVGDIAGTVSDVKDFIQNGDDWGWSDYGLIAAGALPWVPNRGVLKKGGKAVEEILGDGKAITKVKNGLPVVKKFDETLNVNNAARQKLEAHLLDAKNNTYDVTQAKNLTGEKRGLIFVTETPTGPAHARLYEEESPGAFSSLQHKKPAKPALRLDNPDGDDFVKFDSAVVGDDGLYLVLIDSKSKIAPPFELAREGLRDTLRRVGSALKQNNDPVLNGPKFRVFYDFPSEEKAREAIEIIEAFGYSDVVTVRVRKASKSAQEQFKKLREK